MVPGPPEEVRDHTEAGFQEFQFSGVGAAEIFPRNLTENDRVCPGTGDFEALASCLIQVAQADVRAAPEMKGCVQEFLGDGLVLTPLDEEAGLPVVAEPQALHLPFLPEDDGEPEAIFDLLAAGLDGFIRTRRTPGNLSVEARRRPVEVTGMGMNLQGSDGL